MSGLYTIPPDLCFVTTLAQGLWTRAAQDPLRLASMFVYLPTRRACRALREAFLRVTEARATLLPRLCPLGDIDEDEMDFAQAGALDSLPPALSPLQRQMLLMQLVLKKDGSLPLDQAASLAQALGQFLDLVQSEERDFAAMESLVPDIEAYQKHWQESLVFLEIVSEMWPQILRERGVMDGAARRNALLRAQAALWEKEPPAFPVIAAGSTGAVPSVATLLNVISGLPQGEVIFPGLDLSLDPAAWEVLDETHPQFLMKQFLTRFEKTRDDVRLWPDCPRGAGPRVRFVQESLRPAAVTEAWRFLDQETLPPTSFAGIERLDLEHPREEADVIALRLRSVLEKEGETAALVTPDRALAARVAAALERWGIQANDSAGTSLHLWPVGRFLIDILQAAQPQASPVSYLALLKHPLAAAGLSTGNCRRNARLAEKALWRGVRLAGGWRGAAQAAADKSLSFAPWLDEIAQNFAPLLNDWFEAKPIPAWISLHSELAQKLARTAQEDGASRLWRGEAGEAVSLWLDEWAQASADFPPITGAAYSCLFESLIRQVMVRPLYGQHPRISILGPLEARLLHHNLVILGGMNEGTWPAISPPDPWLSRPMKRAFHLPLPEVKIGASAHDFEQLCGAAHVVLTRSRRAGGAPTVPSRFLLQMETVLRAAGYGAGVDEDETLLPAAHPWAAWARLLDHADGPPTPTEKPEPRPPVANRPRQLSVTEIGTWQQNPYAIYAKHILRLKKLEEIDADVDASDFGSLVHDALEQFMREYGENWPTHPLPLLLAEGEKGFALYRDRPQVKAFWWTRFERMARWFVDEQSARVAAGYKPLLIEGKGSRTFCGGSFTLTGRVDRLDLTPTGGCEIIDYKTGYTPSQKQVLAGYEPQLPLLALMARAGGFEGQQALEKIEKLSFWKLQEKDDDKKITAIDAREDLLAKTQEGLETLVRTFADPATPYQAEPKPYATPRYNDYAHLSRAAEWGVLEEGGE